MSCSDKNHVEKKKASAKCSERLKAYIGVVVSVIFLFVVAYAWLSASGSLAWFSSNKDVSANGMGIKVSDISGKARSYSFYEIHSVELVQDGEDFSNVFHFKNTAITGEVKMPTLSAIDAKRQILIKIELIEEGEVSLRAQAMSDKYITYGDDKVTEKDTFYKGVDNSGSSVIQFSVIRSSDVTLDKDGEIGFSVPQTSFQPLDQSGSMNATFADFNEDGTPGTFKSEIELYKTPSGTDSVVYIMVDYYEVSANYVRDFVNGCILNNKSDVVQGENINFVCDFSLIVY